MPTACGQAAKPVQQQGCFFRLVFVSGFHALTCQASRSLPLGHCLSVTTNRSLVSSRGLHESRRTLASGSPPLPGANPRPWKGAKVSLQALFLLRGPLKPGPRRLGGKKGKNNLSSPLPQGLQQGAPIPTAARRAGAYFGPGSPPVRCSSAIESRQPSRMAATSLRPLASPPAARLPLVTPGDGRCPSPKRQPEMPRISLPKHQGTLLIGR